MSENHSKRGPKWPRQHHKNAVDFAAADALVSNHHLVEFSPYSRGANARSRPALLFFRIEFLPHFPPAFLL